MINVATVHYNTPELTTAWAKSIKKWMPDAKITVFDNSNRRPFPDMDGVTVIDNRRQQVVDFDSFLEQYPKRDQSLSQCGSVKHTMSVDMLWEYLPDGFILFDSDTLLERDISDWCDPEVAWVGEIQAAMILGGNPFRQRLLPFCCWINVPLCKAAGIRYFDPQRTWRLVPSMLYDTGASFFLDCRRAGLKGREVSLRGNIVHFKGGTWEAKEPSQWLRENIRCYKGVK